MELTGSCVSQGMVIWIVSKPRYSCSYKSGADFFSSISSSQRKPKTAISSMLRGFRKLRVYFRQSLRCREQPICQSYLGYSRVSHLYLCVLTVSMGRISAATIGPGVPNSGRRRSSRSSTNNRTALVFPTIPSLVV